MRIYKNLHAKIWCFTPNPAADDDYYGDIDNISSSSSLNYEYSMMGEKKAPEYFFKKAPT